MENGYYIFIALVIIAVAYAYFQERFAPALREKKVRSTWLGLLILGALVGGLMIAAYSRNEVWTWLFGLALMVALPFLFLIAIGSSLGSALFSEKTQSIKPLNKKFDKAALISFALAIMCAGYLWVSVPCVILGIFFWLKNKKII